MQLLCGIILTAVKLFHASYRQKTVAQTIKNWTGDETCLKCVLEWQLRRGEQLSLRMKDSERVR